MTTPYDVRARVVECANCGAPLTVADGTAAQCEFCGTHNRVTERPNDGRGPLTPAQEVARLGQLKAQQEHPVPGHLYDLSGLPPTLMFEGATAESRTDLAALHRLWNHSKLKAPDGLEPQRALCWVAIHAARLLSSSEQHEGARAKLETALNYLEDPGHRLLVRAELCLEAIRRGELAAARGWLSECDPAPEVLELDSASRYASARICLAENDPARALALVGPQPGVMPVAKSMAPHFTLVRISALELGRRFDEASLHWSKFPGQLGEEQLITIALREGLASHTRLAPMENRARSLCSQIENARSWHFSVASALTWAPFVTLVLALIFSVEGCATRRGPLLGTTAIPVCSVLCESCETPATYHFWSTNGSGHHAVFCDSPQVRPSQMDWMTLMTHEQAFPHLEVPGGGGTMYAVAYVFLFPLGIFTSLFIGVSKRGGLKAKLADNQKRLAALEPHLLQAGREVRPLPTHWWGILATSLLFLLFMSSCAGVSLTACSAEKPALSSEPRAL